jgi:hypothetical protein
VSAVTRHIGRNHGGKESEEGQAGEEEGSEAHLEEEEVARSPNSSLA